MIEILKQPNTCSLTKNSMIFEVKSNQFFATPKILPKIRLEFDEAFTAGCYFQFQFLNPETLDPETVSFRTINEFQSPQEGDLSAYDTSGPVLSANLNTETLRYVSLLKKIKLLSAYYTVVFVDNGIIDIIAKEPLLELVPTNVLNNLNEGFGITFSSTISEAYNLPIERSGYQMKAFIYYNDPSVDGNETNFELLTSTTIALDENATGLLDVSEIIDGKIESDWQEIPLPQIVNEITPNWWFMGKNLRSYFVVFKETWIGETQDFSVQSSKLYAHWGGISTDDEIRNDGVNQIMTFNNFLTWIPSGKMNHVDQLDFLHFMNGGIELLYMVKLKLYTNQNTTTYTLQTGVDNFIRLKAFESFGIYANLSYYLGNEDSTTVPISLATGEEVKKYEFLVLRRNLENGDIMTNDPICTYLFNVENSCNKKFILYYNSFGVPESFSTQSTWLEKINISSELASRGLAWNDSVLRAKNFIFNSTNQNSIQIESSLLTREVAKRLQAMLISTHTFIEENGRWIPVVMQTKNAEFWNNSEYIVYLPIDLIKANSNDRVSFFKTLPTIIYQRSDYADDFNLQLNGFQISTAGDLLLYKDQGIPYSGANYLVDTLSFDDVNLKWSTGVNETDWHTNGLAEGVYFYKTTVTDKNGVEHLISGMVEIKYEKLVLFVDSLAPNLITEPSLSSDVYVQTNFSLDTDDFVSQNIYPYGYISFGLTYTKDGYKKVVIQSPTFKHINLFTNGSTTIGDGCNMKFDTLDPFNQITALTLQKIQNTEIFLNNLQKLEQLFLAESSIEKISFGFLPNIQNITLRSLDLDETALEDFIRELWNFRKIYGHAITLNLTTMVAANAETTAMIDGTGVYGGDGLVNNSFTVNIT